MAGLNRDHMPSIMNVLFSFDEATMRRALAADNARGFSHITAFLCFRQRTDCCSWKECGVAMYTTSTPGSVTRASYESYDFSALNWRAKSAARLPSRDAMA